MDIYQGRDEIRAHALEEAGGSMPRECCGLIVRKGQKQQVVRCRNVSTEPHHTFLMPPEDFRKAEEIGPLLACYHSHVFDSAAPSDGDKTVSEANKLPFLIYSTMTDMWDYYAPCGWRAKLEGRPFFHGILDCYTLMKDYYDEVLGIQLEDFHREDDWWKSGPNQKNLYLQHAESQGFVQVKPPIHVHDIILMYWLADVPNHAAVYCEPGLILHHPPGHLSHKVCYGGFYMEHTHGIYRHRSLL